MIKLIKLFTWLKGKWMLVTFLISAIALIGFNVQTYRANKWERAHLQLEGKLEEQLKDQNLLHGEAERAQAVRRLEQAEEQTKRKELEDRIRQVIEQGKRDKRELEREKKKTAVMPATELVAEIVERIGFESDLTKSGLYLFTRKGTERTLDRFKDGEFYLSEYNKFQGVLDDHKAEVESFNTSIGECEETGATNLEGWEDCRETLQTALDDVKAMEKVSTAVVWRGRVQGAAAGSIITIVTCKILGLF